MNRFSLKVYIYLNKKFVFYIYFETLPRPYLTLKLFVGLGNDSRTHNNPKNKHHSKVFFDIFLNKSLLRPLNLLKQYVIR